MRNTLLALSFICLALALSGCGTTPKCRLWSSAAFGAAVGTVVPGLGTAVGAIVGGAVGASTTQKQFDVGNSWFCD